MGDCDNGQYTSPAGLGFEIFCAEDAAGGFIKSLITDTFNLCLSNCSATGVDNVPCGGIVYDIADKICYLKSEEDMAGSDISDSDAYNYAVANSDDLQGGNSDCQFPDGSEQISDNGLAFRIYCDSNYNEHDFNPTTRTHADSLQECMESCSKARPLCLAVTYDPDMGGGYANCYHKTSNDIEYINTEAPGGHTAVTDLKFNGTCNDGGLSVEGSTFEVSCFNEAEGDDIAVFHEDNLEDCMGRCVGFASENSTAPECKAVLYDASNRNGYENCYLRAEIGGMEQSTDYSVAVLSGPAKNEDGEDGSGSNTGVIVGAVIGGLAAVALAGAALWWWRRRRRRQASGGEYPPDNKDAKSPAYMLDNRPPNELHSSPVGTRPSELEAPNRPHEIG